MSTIGRISGPLLNANLLRNGIDLSFETDQLYFNVNDGRIGINKDNPVYDLDVNNFINTTNLIADVARMGNVRIFDNTFSTVTGPLNIQTTDGGSVISYAKIQTDDLEFDNSRISGLSSNQNIELNPQGSGLTSFESNVHITNDLYVTGNINVDGNLSTQSNIIIGDEILDTITIAPDFTQSIIPGTDSQWSLGENTGDSSPRRWSQMFMHDLTQVTTNLPQAVKVSDQLWLDGTINKISTLQSNDDVILSPDTGIYHIEQIDVENNTITNTQDTAITLASTGIGYVRFVGDNGVVIPSGTSAERPPAPELGDTRWNTDEKYLECYDGTVYAVATGGGETVTQRFMEDLGFVYSVVLG